MWNTISKGKSSPRKEILLNIDLKHQKESDELSAITYYEGIALRSGDMKLLMTVPNSSWYKPPELEGNPDHKLDWPQGGIKVWVNYIQLSPEEEVNCGGDIYRDAKRRGICLELFTDPGGIVVLVVFTKSVG